MVYYIIISILISLIFKGVYDLLKSKILSKAEKIILGCTIIVLPLIGVTIFYRYQHNKFISRRSKNNHNVF